ncbi:KTSC domain-containing protein [Paucibacter sp. O1-1]|nr:KTSC domain-containing protein [Paucibacter sp. O1-1]MDA3827807.1 KTSC domain-containing protein [Paucibacter sp. O1-1]
MTQQSTPVLQIALQPVVSGNLKAVGYDAATQTLDVQFSSGRVYRYSGVPAKAHEELIAAESIGSHFARNVRNKFPGVDLETLDQHEGATPD